MDGISVRLAEGRRRCYTGDEIVMDEFIPGWRNGDGVLQARLLATLGTVPFAAPYTTNASAAAFRGIPAFLLGPGSIDQAHVADEWITLDQLDRARDAYLAVVRMFLVG
jgi:acetylornithine deacetylase